MKRNVLFVVIALLSSGFLITSVYAGPLASKKDKVSYGIGVEAARNLKALGVDLNLDAMATGLKDAYEGKKLAMTEEEFQATMKEHHEEVRARVAEAMKKAAEKNKKESDAFLEQNKKKTGVVTLASGLQYKVLKQGKGAKPGDSDAVKVNSRGTLIDGREFNNSAQGKGSGTLKVSTLIPGLKEALKLMPVGSKWQVFVPPQLAYGERIGGPGIGPNQALIFEIELTSINK